MSTPDPRSRRAGLTRDQVLTAALELLDARGLRGFTLRALAGELGVDPMTIYWHIKGKDEILEGVVGLLLGSITPDETGPWHEQAAAMFRAHRRLLLEHPAVVDVLLTRPMTSAEAWAGAERFLLLVEPLLGRPEAGLWLRVLAAYTNGYLLTERPALEQQPSGTRNKQKAASSGTSEVPVQLGQPGDIGFETGLAVLIDAMRATAQGAPAAD